MKAMATPAQKIQKSPTSFNRSAQARRIRVLHYYRTYFPDTQGGLEEAIRQICLNTQPYNVESRILTLSDTPHPRVLRREEAVVYRAKKQVEIASCSMGLGAMRQFHQLSAWADVIHFHFPWPFADISALARQASKPYIVTYHSDIVRQRLLNLLYAPMRSMFLKKAQSIVATSPNYLATSPILRKNTKKVSVIPIGLSKRIYPDPTLDILRKAADQYGKDFFLFIGVMRYYKGLDVLLEAMIDAPYRVVICGKGPSEAALHRKAKELKLNNVIFAGQVSDSEKRALLKLSRAVVLPSSMRSEAFGVTLVEGAMFERPLISAEVGSGTTYINRHNETGVTVKPGCAVSLRGAMDTLWYNPEQARAMGRRARQLYFEEFTGEAMGRKYTEIYQNAIESNKASIYEADRKTK